jgi:hypothetical protein
MRWAARLGRSGVHGPCVDGDRADDQCSLGSGVADVEAIGCDAEAVPADDQNVPAAGGFEPQRVVGFIRVQLFPEEFSVGTIRAARGVSSLGAHWHRWTLRPGPLQPRWQRQSVKVT